MIFRVPVYLQNRKFVIRKFVFNTHFSDNMTVVVSFKPLMLTCNDVTK